jgi:RNA polymerase-binding transcription factor DksA
VSTTSAVRHQAGAEPAARQHAAVSASRHLAVLAAERARLERVVAELVAAAPSELTGQDDLGEIASASQHPADVASETLEREVDLGLLDEFRAALAEVDAAVARVADGTYGTCQRCAERIASERLRAVPATRWCLGCAQVAERDQRWASPSERRRAAILPDAEFLPRDDDFDADVPVERSSEEAAVTIR